MYHTHKTIHQNSMQHLVVRTENNVELDCLVTDIHSFDLIDLLDYLTQVPAEYLVTLRPLHRCNTKQLMKAINHIPKINSIPLAESTSEDRDGKEKERRMKLDDLENLAQSPLSFTMMGLLGDSVPSRCKETTR